MMKDRIIGPFFFQEGTVTSHSYLEMLEHYTGPQLSCDAWFQRDGAPSHFGNIVRHFLNERFPNKWIGRGGFLAWPPRTPDLTPLDFFFWGYVKNIFYQEKIADLRALRHCITEAVVTVTEVMLVNTWREIEYRSTCVEQLMVLTLKLTR
jgi:hypothetical protein